MSDLATLEYGDVKVSAPLAKIESLIAGLFAPPAPAAEVKTVQGVVLHADETYAGLLLDEKTGEPAGHLVLVAIADTRRSWSDQKEWAESVGGRLATRQEGALLFANLKRLFTSTWYWLGTESSEYDAYGQYFDNGGQGGGGKGGEALAVAVRVIPLSNSSI